MTERARADEKPWAPWLVLAVCLHALGWLCFRPPELAKQSHDAPPDSNEASVSVELDASEPENRDASPAAPLPGAATAPLSERKAQEPSLARALSAGLRIRGAPAMDPAPAASGAESAVPSEVTEAAALPHLSLQSLGVGGENPFLSKRAEHRPSAREVGKQRFQQAMAAEIVRADQAVGLGPEGPALTRIEAATRTGNPAPNSNALFEFTTDSQGQLLAVELLESSSDPTPWRRIARSARAALGSTRLRLPKAGYGVTFRVRVTSHVELPSGADPGLSVNVAGIPIKRGAGPRSARIDILSIKPELSDEEVRLPSGQTAHVPTLKLGSLLSAAGDLADIGSPARRMVRAHLESLTVNDAKPADTL